MSLRSESGSQAVALQAQLDDPKNVMALLQGTSTSAAAGGLEHAAGGGSMARGAQPAPTANLDSPLTWWLQEEPYHLGSDHPSSPSIGGSQTRRSSSRATPSPSRPAVEAR